jgi:ABC-2 type transport system permease protein
LNKVLTDNVKNVVNVQTLAQRKSPKSMDYYAISILTLFILYSSLTGSFAVKGEKIMKTADRLMCCPVKKYEILIGKILGTFIVSSLQVTIVFLFTRFVLKADWGTNLGVIILLLLSEILMAVSLGIGLAFAIKNDMAITAIIQTIIPFIAFLGGGYIPVDNFNKYLLNVADFTPLRWINRSLFQVIYANDFSTVWGAVIINLAIAVIFVTIASVKIRREA